MTRPLSPRQAQVMRLLLAGKPRKRICTELGIEMGTVIYHQNELYKRLRVTSRGELTARYMAPTDEARRLMEGA